MTNLTLAQVVSAIDRAFAPDIRITLDDNYRIIAYQALTLQGCKGMSVLLDHLNEPFDGLSIPDTTIETVGPDYA